MTLKHITQSHTKHISTMASQDIDHLEEDFITVPGQRFALVSFVSPTSRQKTEQSGMKIRGVFATREEAAAHVKRLQKIDASFDIFMMEMYKWVCVPPDITKIEDVEYQETYLQELISGYKKSQEDAKLHFQERKQQAMSQGIDATLTDSERITLPEDTHPSTSGSHRTGQTSGSDAGPSAPQNPPQAN